ncbi:hypothetical protein B0H67DRAFT_557471 [Lasiosphaeris hirsuta]|uniref:Uncharacterized protein n=1 Tax=Lasiosphaeris hirsuta TaxID=260670 RepID=A0AA39ZWC3_9PEZI|nr:hypothetical protein B0H67DRAFT_557471 [Lasiosphaeris hirsuta]
MADDPSKLPPVDAIEIEDDLVEEPVSADPLPAGEPLDGEGVMDISQSPLIATPDHDSLNGGSAGESRMNGGHVNGNGLHGVHLEDDHLDDTLDDDNLDGEGDYDNPNERLSTPPDSPISPIDEPMSRTPSVPINAEDEIVVGTNAHKRLINKPSTSPVQVVSEPDIEMEDAEDESLAPQKRKRTSTFADQAETLTNPQTPRDDPEGRASKLLRPAKTHGTGNVKGTLLGYWRDSEPEDHKDKHGVIGFIDVRDRLRTRIQTTTRDGRDLSRSYPLPPGPGGSWVTFQQVAFDSHLVQLNQHQVKEYVKIRVESQGREDTLEERHEAELAAVQEAIRRVQQNPPAVTTTEPLIAYGPEIPDNAQQQHRPESKKRRLNRESLAGTPTPVATPGGSTSSILNQQPADPMLNGTRPTRILLGYWRGSSEVDPWDKHAVYGILGANDMFRVKLMRETRDGRTLHGNFPSGAGGLWIHWEEVEFETFLKNLSRPEIKEYCRVRQWQLDSGELPEEREKNQKLAVKMGQDRATKLVPTSSYAKREDMLAPFLAMKTPQMSNGTRNDSHLDYIPDHTLPLETRQRRAAERAAESGPRARHSLPGIELRAANRPPAPSLAERTNSIARREVERAEAVIERQQQRAGFVSNGVVGANSENVAGYAGNGTTSRTVSPSDSNKMQFQNNVERLDKVWAAQEADRLKAGSEDAKIYMGVKYERKQNGPFEGKLVSQGTIISIDGEDYVEYRVLTKPSFF